MVALGALLNNLFSQTTSWLNNQQRSDLSLPELCEQLLSNKGEVTGLSLAREILGQFEQQSSEEQKAFLTTLTTEFDLVTDELHAALKMYEAKADKASYSELMTAATSRRQTLFRKLNELPGATQRLVNMRKTLLGLLPAHPELAVIDQDLKQLFTSWFNRGFLVLQPISWSSPAHILEKIIAYEAVHAIESWDDLRRRLQPADRRCFAFFHPAMPDEPLIFVEIALSKEIPEAIQTILADRSEADDSNPKTATFYSISNCQTGLAGISFGNSLIKTVVSELRREFESLEQFVTLSPLPVFADWMSKQSFIDALPLEDDQKITDLAACYLVHGKTHSGTPVDPVARFHLGNGARIHALHANADSSAIGKSRSHAVMVNYLYDLEKLEANHQKYASDGVVACSGKIKDRADAALHLLNELKI
ncbi:MAG: decarboxylase [Rhodospirillaceae bacterium]|nr:decarboxylase [Rhodospirillaceae bacterium]